MTTNQDKYSENREALKEIEAKEGSLVDWTIPAEEYKELLADLDAANAIMKEAADYLDTNDLTSIGHGSILHQKFRQPPTDKEPDTR